MLRLLRTALFLTLLFTAATGILYPLAITGFAQIVFPTAANGSLVKDGDRVIGSRLIGQAFASSCYFLGRPSATQGVDPADATRAIALPYNAAASAGSNWGPSSAALIAALRARAAAFDKRPIPIDLLTASASGLDPDISPAAAFFQVERVASARGLAEAVVRDLVRRHSEDRQWFIFGEPRVNVLALNMELDSLRSCR